MTRLVMSRSLWLITAIVALSVLISSSWLVKTRVPADLPQAAPARADYYLRDAEIDVMDENGQLSYRLRTAELLRFNDHSSQMTDVKIDSLGGSKGVWQLEAGKAVIGENQEHLMLSNGVRLRTQAPQGATLLTTQNMKVGLKDNRMATTDPVHIKGPEFETRAIGLQASLKSRDLTLMNNVQTRYAP